MGNYEMSSTILPKKTRPWHLANTTVRNPYRLKGGLEALLVSGFEGSMDKTREEAIALALDKAGVISLSEDTKDITSIARKWRGALVKMGFLWPDPSRLRPRGSIDSDRLGSAFTLTPNGRRLLQAESLQAQQEVFLRALSALRLKSPIESGYDFPAFSPLRHVISVIRSLENAGEEPSISWLEMATIIIFTNGAHSQTEIVDEIVALRLARRKASSLRKFDSARLEETAARFGLRHHQTLRDYQDVSFRYLKATGLFQSKGKGITFATDKRKIISLLANEAQKELSPTEYIIELASGAKLPTDAKYGAREVLGDLMDVADDLGVSFDLSSYDLNDAKGVSLARYDLEAEIFLAREHLYAREQSDRFDEILAYLSMLDLKKTKSSFRGEELRLPKDEFPAYFEWSLWRILLALGGLESSSDQVRRFKIDQDFLPVGTAPGGGADLIAHYPDCSLVVEVTLTENSRQEAAEGEPVRRHVADVLEQVRSLGREVYGLFVARRVDTNTAETFRIGVWYLGDDDRVALDIVPLSITQLVKLLRKGVAKHGLHPKVLLDPLRDLTALRARTKGAPEWKNLISLYTDSGLTPEFLIASSSQESISSEH